MLRTIGLVLLVSVSAQAQFTADAVYRGDTRLEIFEVQDARIRQAADATVAVFDSTKLERRGADFFFDTTPMSKAMKVCDDEKYADQPSASDCSGVLVGSDRILTAGHCISTKTCATTAFVFGYANAGSRDRVERFPATSVFNCKRILARSDTESFDFALVEIDRPVPGRVPVTLADARVERGEGVYLLSHPAGTPLKYSPPNDVLSSNKKRFSAEIDALGGSSGGAVFSADTHELVGVLVAGEEDYVKDKKKGCRRILHCEPGRCIGEESTHAAAITAAIPSLN